MGLRLVAVMGPVCNHGSRRNWLNLDDFFNPCRMFEQVHIVSMDDDYDYGACRFETLCIHPVRPLTRIRRLKILNNLVVMARSVVTILSLVRTHQPDLIVQTYGGPLKYGLPAVYVARRAGLPVVITMHNDYPALMAWTYPFFLRWVSGRLWRYVFQNSTRIRAVSDYVARFAREMGVPEEKLEAIPNKEDLTKFLTPPTLEEKLQVIEVLDITELLQDAIVFLTVGRLIKAKNLERQLCAFALALQQQPNLAYLIVGTGPLRARLEDLTQRLDIASRVRFLGFVPHDQLRNVYRLSDVFLFATLFEGQPRVVIEALLSGLPIICANYGQVTDVVMNGKDGIWVDPMDVDSIAAAIVCLAQSEDLRLALACHEDFDRHAFDIESVSRREAKFYQTTIDSLAAPDG